jgi:CheY-like chemotaxis protein
LTGVRVLVVDDEPDARDLARRLLEECHAHVATAGSVEEALQQFDAVLPDVLICDIGMPGQDGYDMIRRVRGRSPESGGIVPAAALTAFAREEDRRRAMTAGYQTHIAKPVDAARFLSAIARLAGRGKIAEIAMAKADTTSTSRGNPARDVV